MLKKYPDDDIAPDGISTDSCRSRSTSYARLPNPGAASTLSDYDSLLPRLETKDRAEDTNDVP